jgi:hypothetical protein
MICSDEWHEIRSGSALEFDFSLFKLFDLVHRDVFVDKFIDLFVHLSRELPPGNSSEAHDEENHKDDD